MGLYNFKQQFVPAIEAGTKSHTIRAHRKHPQKLGGLMHLYTGLRRPGARKLGSFPCVKIEEIRIEGGFEALSDEFFGAVHIDETRLSDDECEALARRDGFDSFHSMMKFWDGRRPFAGQILHWKR